MKISGIPAFPFVINLWCFILTLAPQSSLKSSFSWLSEKSSDGGRVLWWPQLQGKQRSYSAPAQLSFSGHQIDGPRNRLCYVGSLLLLPCKHSCAIEHRRKNLASSESMGFFSCWLWELFGRETESTLWLLFFWQFWSLPAWHLPEEDLISSGKETS